MKKFLSVLILILAFVPFCGCKEEDVERASYKISATFNEDMTVSCKMNYSVVLDSEQSGIYFNLYPNAFSEDATVSPVYKSDELSAYPNGKSYGKVEVFSVKVEGLEANYEISGINDGTLKVGFENNKLKGEAVDVYMDFKVSFPLMQRTRFPFLIS